MKCPYNEKVDIKTNISQPVYFDGSFLENNSGIGRDSRNLLKACVKVFGGNLKIIYPSLSFLDKLRIVATGKVKRIQLPVGAIFIQSHIFGILPETSTHQHIVRLHDLFPLTNPEWFRFAQKRVFVCTFKAMGRNTKFICDSEFTEKILENVTHASEFSSAVAYCPVDIPDSEQCDQCAVCNGYLPENFVLAVGTLEPRKNYVFIAKAWMSWRSQRRLDVNLVVCGNRGWKVTKILYWFRRAKKHGLIWLPHICDAGMKVLLEGAMGLVSASKAEGFNLPVAEAALLGLKIAISDIGVHREIYPNAFFFSIDNPDKVSFAFDYLTEGSRKHEISIIPHQVAVETLATCISELAIYPYNL